LIPDSDYKIIYSEERIKSAIMEEMPEIREILKPSTMIISIIGFVISAVYTASGRFTNLFNSFGENFGISIGFAFCLVFLLMFIASVVSITPSGKELKEFK
jgi:hypothetical protein